jgi:hypothetical protein
MSARALALLLGPALALAACGGSSSSSSSSAPPSSSSSSSTATTTAASSTSAGGEATATRAKSSTNPPEVPSTQPTKTTRAPSGGVAPAGGASNVHVRAAFTIHGRSISPSTLTVPAFVAVELTIASGDGQPHQVVIRLPSPRSARVPAGGHAAVALPGTKAGRYGVSVDGHSAGSLLVGGEVGP